MLAAEGARSTRVGAHLLRGEPAGDPAVVVLLREAARAALADGAPQTAVRLLRRTLAEPPGTKHAGWSWRSSARPRRSRAIRRPRAHLREALELVVAPAIRARLVRILSELLLWDGRAIEAHGVIVQMIDELGPSAAPPLRAGLETLRALMAIDRPAPGRRGRASAPALRELAAAAGYGRSRTARARRMLAGGTRPVLRGLARAARRRPRSRTAARRGAGGPADGQICELPHSCSPTRCSAHRTQIAAVRRRHAVTRVDRCPPQRADLGRVARLPLGELAAAEADARAALEARRAPRVAGRGFGRLRCSSARSARARRARRGRQRARQAPIEAAIDTIAGGPRCWRAAGCGWRRGGRSRRSRIFARSARSRPWTTRTGCLAVHACAGAAAWDPERRGRSPARSSSGHAGSRSRAESGSPFASAACSRAARTGVAMLTEACEWLRSSPARLELARALFDLGAARRRAGKRSAAREPLREALGLAEQCGALRSPAASTRGARGDGRPSAPRPGVRARGADSRRAPRRGARRERTDQPRDRPDAVRVGQDHRYASRPHLREARPPGTAGAGAAGRTAQRAHPHGRRSGTIAGRRSRTSAGCGPCAGSPRSGAVPGRPKPRSGRPSSGSHAGRGSARLAALSPVELAPTPRARVVDERAPLQLRSFTSDWRKMTWPMLDCQASSVSASFAIGDRQPAAESRSPGRPAGSAQEQPTQQSDASHDHRVPAAVLASGPLLIFARPIDFRVSAHSPPRRR